MGRVCLVLFALFAASGSTDSASLETRPDAASGLSVDERVLPDNPCEVIPGPEMAAAIGVPVIAVHEEPVTPSAPKLPRICMYDTGTAFGSVAIIVEDPSYRTRSEYWSSRHASFETHRTETEFVPSIGKDAWFSGGIHLHVLLRDDGSHVTVSTPIRSSRSRDILLRAARAIADRFAAAP